MCGFSPVISDVHDFALSSEITSFLVRKIREKNLGLKPAECLSALAVSRHHTLAKQENIELLDLALELSGKHGRVFRDEAELEKAIYSDAGMKAKLDWHVGKWNWIDHGYIGPAYAEKDFVRELLRLLREEDLAKEKQRLTDSTRKLIEEQERMEKLFDFNETELTLVKAARDFMFAKAYRVDVRNKAYCAIGLLLKEVSRRTGYSYEELHSADLNELLAIIVGENSVSRDVLSKRHDFAVWLQEGQEVEIFHDAEARRVFAREVLEEAKEEVFLISGQVACVGFAKGVVKIVRGEGDISKVEKGDILVSPMTNPHLLPAMLKAAAFVTDTGGVTSHAAIVAREMNKPCVIGTLKATRVFKDGDVVEVDATNGIVRKVG